MRTGRGLTMTTPMRLLLGLVLLLVSGCTAARAPEPAARAGGEVLFAGPVDALAPFRHGNRYSYLVTSEGEQDREVESRCSVAGNRIFLTVTQGEAVLARTEMILETNHLLVVSEVSPQHDMAFTYDPPLAVLRTPVRVGVQREKAKLRAWKPSDGTEIAKGTVELAWSAHPAPAAMTDASLEIRTVKKIALDNGRNVTVTSKRWLAPGVGEIGSTGTAGEGRVEHRELTCARVGESEFGACGLPILRSGR